MPSIYIRVPHYIAAFMRNFNEADPHKSGEPFVVDEGDPLYIILRDRTIANIRSEVSYKCFSELQFKAMQRGKYLAMHDGLMMDISRDSRKPLTMSEIYLLSGNEDKVIRDPQTMELMPDCEYHYEYLQFALPRVVVRNGREVKVYPNWYLPDTSDFRAELSDRFHIALVKFVAKEYQIIYNQLISSSPSRARSRAKVEAIDRFMLRYDIRPDARSRELIKKSLRRSSLAASYSIGSEIDHADWSAVSPIREPSSLSRRVICLDTGDEYDSISACARHIGVDYKSLSIAIRRGSRCHGFRVEYIV